jgi:hypothetical protein
MKKIYCIIYSAIISLILVSCFNADYNNANDRYSDSYNGNNPKLKNIIISDGQLSPAFCQDVTEYIVNLSHLNSWITITPLAINDASIIQINGSPIHSGNSSGSISLNLIENEIMIHILSEDLAESIEYKITVNIFYCDFICFGFKSTYNNSRLSQDLNGIIDNNSNVITINLPPYTDISLLVASFCVNETAHVKVGNVLQTSDATSNNFSTNITYTVTDVVPSGYILSKNYTVIINSSKWESYLKPPNIISANDEIFAFGNSISISGNTVAVGAPGEKSTTTSIINGSDLSSTNNNGNQNGAVYVFKQNGSSWSHEAYLKPPNNDDFDHFDQFGYSVSISGDTIAVGSPGEDSLTSTIINGSDLSSTNNDGSRNGAVYVFKRNGNIWSHEAYLKPPNNSYNDSFGNSVSISGDTIAVGAEWEGSTTTNIINGSDLSSTNNDSNCGAVYVFRRNNIIWSFESYLKPPNNSNIQFSDYGSFGYSVSISDETIAVGAPGEKSTTNTIINSSDLSSTNYNGDRNGAVYVFKRNANMWSHQAYLKAPNNSNGDSFGYSVCIDSDTIVVGAPYEESNKNLVINNPDLSSTNNNGYQNGSAYVFKRDNNIWAFEAYLKAPNTSQRDIFGFSVSIFSNLIVVSAPYEESTSSAIINGTDLSSTNNDGYRNGAAYVFMKNNNQWLHTTYLKAPNNNNLLYYNNPSAYNSFYFGVAVSVSNNNIAITAPHECSSTNTIVNSPDEPPKVGGYFNGAVYIFH